MKYLFILSITLFNLSFAQLTLDRTRVIFDQAKSNSQSVVVMNTSKSAPYLAQSWIEDDSGNKIETPLVALPILQRINPGQEKQVKISLAGINNLPQDRESMLFFNVLGVPPKTTDIQNQLNIVFQTKVKLFYRPKGLQDYKNSGWIKELEVSKSGSNTYTLYNPTAYHLVIYALSNGTKGKAIKQDLIIKPFSTETIKNNLGTQPTFYFLNDYGSTVKQSYQCTNTHCTLIP